MTSPPWPLSWPDDAPAYERAQALVARSDRVGDAVDQALDDIENDAVAARRASVVAADGTAYWAVLIVVGAETVVIYWRKRESDASHYIAYVGPPPSRS